jgi:hypothetical protein
MSFVVVRYHWTNPGGLATIAPEHVQRGDQIIAAGSLAACWSAKRLLRDPSRQSAHTYTDGNDYVLAC